MSRHQAMRTWHGSRLTQSLARQGIVIRGHSARGIAEEAPAAYKDVDAVVQAAHDAGIARKVARLLPVISIKGWSSISENTRRPRSAASFDDYETATRCARWRPS